MAGLLASGGMAWLLFNRDLRFSSSASSVIEHKGGSIDPDDLVNSVVPDTKSAPVAIVEKIKGLKRCHADEPDW
jgi:hypothetical protein